MERAVSMTIRRSMAAQSARRASGRGRLVLALVTLAAPAAAADPPPASPPPVAEAATGSAAAVGGLPAAGEEPHADLAELAAGETPSPPPLHTPFLQYGVALTAEGLVSAGKLCNVPTEPCVIGSGGGIGVRIGKRSAGPWYFGGTYELSKQDSNKLYRLAILQQARGEARYYIDTGRDVEPYGMLGVGLAGYGNEWSVDTFGPMASISLGVEAQLTRRRVLGAALSYRLAYLKGFTDSGLTPREAGLVSFVGLDLVLEARDPL